MSGVSSNTTQLNILPVALDTFPRGSEGSKTCYFNIQWQNVVNATNDFVVTLNLLQQYQSAQFTTCQYVLIDNQTNPNNVIFTVGESGQTIIVPGFTQGMFPITSSAAPTFIVSMTVAFDIKYNLGFSDVTTNLYFFNTPQKPFLNTLSPIGTNWNRAVTGGSFVSPAPIAVIILPGAYYGPPLNYALFEMLITITCTTAVTAAGLTFLSLFEEDSSGPYLIWQDNIWFTAGVVGTIYRLGFSWGSAPYICRDPYNNVTLKLTGSGGANTQLTVNMLYGIQIIK
jgi:hypothetical protein